MKSLLTEPQIEDIAQAVEAESLRNEKRNRIIDRAVSRLKQRLIEQAQAEKEN